MQIKLIIGKNTPLIMVLVLPAFIGLIPLTISLELSNRYTPENDAIFLIGTAVYLISVIVFTFKGVKAVRTEVEALLTDNQLKIHMLRKTMFHRKDLDISLANIVNLSEDTDQNYDFLYIKTSQPDCPNFHLMLESTNGGLGEFAAALKNSIQLNQNQGTTKVAFVSIYEKWPMRLTGYFLLISWFLLPLIMWQQGINLFTSLRFLTFVALSFPIVIKVLTVRLLKKG